MIRPRTCCWWAGLTLGIEPPCDAAGERGPARRGGHDTRAGPGRASAATGRCIAAPECRLRAPFVRDGAGRERWTGRADGGTLPWPSSRRQPDRNGRVGQPSGYPDRSAPQPSPSSATPPHQADRVPRHANWGSPVSRPVHSFRPRLAPASAASRSPARPGQRHPRRILLAVLVSSLVQAVPVDVGFRDFKYDGGLASRATADSPQSKLWYADGSWWGGLFKAGTGAGNSDFAIYKYNPATETWTNTLTLVDRRDRTHADYLWVAAQNKLYVVLDQGLVHRAAPATTPSASIASRYAERRVHAGRGLPQGSPGRGLPGHRRLGRRRGHHQRRPRPAGPRVRVVDS